MTYCAMLRCAVVLFGYVIETAYFLPLTQDFQNNTSPLFAFGEISDATTTRAPGHLADGCKILPSFLPRAPPSFRVKQTHAALDVQSVGEDFEIELWQGSFTST